MDSRKKKILVAGPPFRGYLEMIAHGFEESGAEPSVLEWAYPKRSLSQEVMFYSSESYRFSIAEAQDRSNAASLERAVMNSSPDYVLVMKAVEVSAAAKKFCADRGIKLVLWAYDSATQFPIISRVAPEYDLVYTYEPGDLDTLSSNSKATFLPLAYDPRFYMANPSAGISTADLCFIGAIDPYPQRRRLIQQIAERSKDSKIAVWSDSIHWYSHRRIRDALFRGARRNIQLIRKTVEHAEANRIYNSSRICLNIHHVQSKMAVNPRTFEILGSGGLLLTDRKLDGIAGFEDGKGYVYYYSAEEAMRRIEELLSQDSTRREIASEGHSRVAAHTYAKRAAKILRDLR